MSGRPFLHHAKGGMSNCCKAITLIGNWPTRDRNRQHLAGEAGRITLHLPDEAVLRIDVVIRRGVLKNSLRESMAWDGPNPERYEVQ